MQRVFSYERVSFSRQATDGRGMERQAGDAEAWCVSRGVALDQELSLADAGASAFHGDHLQGALGRFLALAQAGELGDQPVLLVEAIDRLSRQEPLDGLQDVLLALVKAGVTLVSLEDGQTYSRETLRQDGTRLVMLALKAQAAHEYSKRLSRRIKSSWDQAYAELEAGRLPRGKVFLPPWCRREGDQIHLIPEKADIVRRIFEMALDDGHTVIAGQLNQEGVPTLSGRPSWTRSAVKSLLEDSRVTGAVRINNQKTLSQRRRDRRGERADQERIFPDVLPMVISPETLARTQAAIAARSAPKVRRGRQTDFNLVAQGLIRCSCGARVGTTATSSGRKAGTRKLLRYAKCRHRVSHRDGCRGLGYRLDVLNGHLLTRLHKGQLQQLLTAADAGRSDQVRIEQQAIEKLQAQLQLAEQREANAGRLFKDALLAGRDDPLHRESVEEARLDAELARTALSRAQHRLAGLTRDVDTAEFDAALQALFDAFATGSDTPAQRRAVNVFLRRAGLRVVLDNEQKRVGMAIADGPINWQPLDPLMVQLALAHRTMSAVYRDLTITDRSIPALAALFPDDPGWAEWLEMMKGVKQVQVASVPPDSKMIEDAKAFCKALTEKSPELAEALRAMSEKREPGPP